MSNTPDRCPGQAPDVRFSVDDSITYTILIGVVRGITMKLLLRYTPDGELLAAIEQATPGHPR